MKNGDPLIQALLDCESRLTLWLNECALNTEFFLRDPLGAMRTANLGMDEGLLSDLEATMTGITRKLGAE
jgi:hypothetical protein